MLVAKSLENETPILLLLILLHTGVRIMTLNGKSRIGRH